MGRRKITEQQQTNQAPENTTPNNAMPENTEPTIRAVPPPTPEPKPSAPAMSSKVSELFKNLDNIRAPSDFDEDLIPEELNPYLPIRMPKKDEYFRACHDKNYSETAMIYYDQTEDGVDIYLVLPAVWPLFYTHDTGVRAILTLAVNRAGHNFILVNKYPIPGNKLSVEWFNHRRKYTADAKTTWLKVKANMGQGCYRVTPAEDQSPVPAFSEKPFGELLALAFGEHIIDTVNHPIARKIRGAL